MNKKFIIRNKHGYYKEPFIGYVNSIKSAYKYTKIEIDENQALNKNWVVIEIGRETIIEVKSD